MYDEIYIDIVFMANFLMDYVLLRLVLMVLHYRRKRFWCVLGAILGAVFSCIYVILPGIVPGALLQAVGAVIMLRTGCGIRKKSLLAEAAVFLYTAAFFCGGLWRVLTGGGHCAAGEFPVLLTATYAGLTAFIKIWELRSIRKRNIYPVTLFYQGKKQETYGFCDTGNLLSDPLSGQPVSVVEEKLLQTVLSEELTEKLKHLKENPGELRSTELTGLRPKLIPCRTVAGEVRMLPAVTLEKLCIHTLDKQICVSSPVFAVLFEPSALGKEYKVLLNSRLLH